MFKWFGKFKYRHIGYVTLTGETTSPLLEMLTGRSTVEIEEFPLHFWENGFGKRKVTGDIRVIKQIPKITSWLNGKDLPYRLTE